MKASQSPLNFGDNPENLTIPWNSISTFVDPSVEFGLRFEDEANEDIDDAVRGRGTDA